MRAARYVYVYVMYGSMPGVTCKAVQRYKVKEGTVRDGSVTLRKHKTKVTNICKYNVRRLQLRNKSIFPL